MQNMGITKMTIQEQIADAVEFALIEHLGGYNAAILKRHINYLNDTVDTDLIDTLLNYRRAHNIYEAGDVVVSVDGEPYLHKVELGTSKAHCIKIFSHDMTHSYWVHDRNYRHANDAEIEAGHRL